MRIRLGFVPLSDAAPLIAARACGFFAEEGLQVELSREASWATVRDKVAVGALDGAHMLAPMVLAAALGVGSEPAPLIVPLALARGGAAVALSSRIPAAGLARLVAQRREAGASPLTFAVVFPYSIHAYLLRAWLEQGGIDPDADVRLTVAPPPRMADLLAGGVIEGFCAGEPWAAAAVAAGAGQVAVRAGQLWPGAPDKVFAVTRAWAEADPPRLQAVLRALLRAAAWAEAPGNRAAVADLLARPEHLGLEPELIAAGLDHIVYGSGAPEPRDAAWLLGEMKRWGQIPASLDAAAAAARIYRPDLHAAAAGALSA